VRCEGKKKGGNEFILCYLGNWELHHFLFDFDHMNEPISSIIGPEVTIFSDPSKSKMTKIHVC
jgi:hypothetical protein